MRGVVRTLAIAVALLSAAPESAPATERSPSAQAIVAARAAADAQLAADRRLVGQRLVFGFEGTRPPAWLLARVGRGELAGVILFADNFASRPQLRRATGRLQRAAHRAPGDVRAPLLVMVDQEGGAVRRIPGAPGRSAAEIGASGSRSVARRAGRAAGRNLGDVGINVNLAPVLDVPRAGSAIADYGRAFSERPAAVARLGAAFVKGLHDAGVAATAKHFPGFGAAPVNTDDAPVTLDLPLRALRRIDEAPYPAAIDAGVELVMLSSAVYTAFDPKRPASLSRRVTVDELRGRLGFTGVTITDALGTPGIRRYGRTGQIAVRTVRAGNDLLLYTDGAGEGSRAARALERALGDGRLRRDALREGAARVLDLRRR